MLRSQWTCLLCSFCHLCFPNKDVFVPVWIQLLVHFVPNGVLTFPPLRSNVKSQSLCINSSVIYKWLHCLFVSQRTADFAAFFLIFFLNISENLTFLVSKWLFFTWRSQLSGVVEERPWTLTGTCEYWALFKKRLIVFNCWFSTTWKWI